MSLTMVCDVGVVTTPTPYHRRIIIRRRRPMSHSIPQYKTGITPVFTGFVAHLKAQHAMLSYFPTQRRS
ncbi:hypothetical protein F8196_08260 [Corynebacterium matruchotii]|nr:hypothetical protein F8196_08260 [Corynebacterium matruchotii]